jgi:glycosyltransferase involved in cell wall biosynthesis
LLAAAEAMTHARRRGYDAAFYVPRMGPLLTSDARTATGGAETQILLLARMLAGRGARIRLLVFSLPEIPLPSVVDGVSVVQRPPYLARKRLGKFREVASIGRTVVGADADVLVSRAATPEVGLAAIFAKLSGRRFVYASANVSDFRDRERKSGRRRRSPGSDWDFDFSAFPAKRRDSLLFELGVRLADEVVVQTEEQISLCESRFGRLPTLIRSIAEPAAQRTCEPEAFLWAARLVAYKRPLAYVELARAIPEAKFWMVAPPEDPPDKELRAAVEDGVASLDNLEMLEPRPRAELLELVNRAVAVVNTADFEGMPNTFLEAWSRGVPALSLTHDPDHAITQHGLGAFGGGSLERLAGQGRRLWEGRGDQTELAARCRRYIAEHHSPDAVATRWQEVLDLPATSSVEGLAAS